MTRSIFDPTGPFTERSGSTHTGPDARNGTRMPPTVVDGAVSEEEARDLEVAPADPQDTQAAADALSALAAGEVTLPERVSDPEQDATVVKPEDVQ